MKIYVSNLDFSVQEEDLLSYFTPYGAVASAIIVNDRVTGRPRGFGFVEMENDKEAKVAIEKLDGATVGGRQIKVVEARPKPDRSSGDGFSKRKW